MKVILINLPTILLAIVLIVKSIHLNSQIFGTTLTKNAILVAEL